MEHRRIVEKVRKHDTVMKNVAKILYILLSFWPWFWANIGIPSAIMSTWRSLECKWKAWQIKFQQNGALAAEKMLYSSLSLDPDIGSLKGHHTAKFSYFYTCHRVKPKTAHVKVSSCQISASPHQVQCNSILLCLAVLLIPVPESALMQIWKYSYTVVLIWK